MHADATALDDQGHAFGEGSHRYVADPLPEPVATLRRDLDPGLAVIANRVLGIIVHDAR